MSTGNIQQTPKKISKSSTTANVSSCRLCKSVGDVSCSKNIYANGNRVLLAAAEDIYGRPLRQDNLLPHLLCRPCERRLKNFISFKTVISESQSSFETVKRCTEISPSVPRTLAKSARKSEKKGRRGLNFATVPTQMQSSSGKENELPLNASAIVGNVWEDDVRQQTKSSETDSGTESSLLNQVDRELVEVTRRGTNSVLRARGYLGLSTLNFSEIIKEIQTLCPTVFTFLSKMIQLDQNPEKRTAPLALVYGLIVFQRCHELSRIQRVNTVLLTEGDANQELVDRLHKYGFCLSKTMKYTIQEEIGDHFLDRAVELLKQGKKFVLVLDNIDWDVRVHDMRSDNQNKSVHAVATSVVFNRVSSDHLPDDKPKKNLADCSLKDLLMLTDEEKRCTRERYKIFLGRILCEWFPAFDFFKEILPSQTPCQYQHEMNIKSVVVTLPVLLKDEKKYSDLVDVLDQLEAWVREMYSRAGLCAPPEEGHVPPAPPIAAPSRPDQPLSHVPPVTAADDALGRVRIPCFGDQLTRVRLAGAKDLRAGSHTPQDRLDHLYPFRIVDWHTKRSFLKLVFKRLYKNSGREMGTVRYFREKLQRRNVTQDVKHYEDCEQLFLSLGRCFAIEALIKFFDMVDQNGQPTKNRPPYYILEVGNNKQVYYHSVLDKFMDQFLLQPTQDPVEHDLSNDEDFVFNYSICILKYFFLLLDFKDAVREGNGERLATLHKVLVQHFKSFPGFNAYAIEMLISIVQNEVFLTDAEAHNCAWASTANWTGGPGRNIEIDLLQENRNKDLKKQIKLMGANKTNKAIDRSSRASGGERQIVENYDQQVNRVVHASAHSHQSSVSDEKKILADLRTLKPFGTVPNRKHESFQDISSEPLATLDETELAKWLSRHKKNLLMDAPFIYDDED